MTETTSTHSEAASVEPHGQGPVTKKNPGKKGDPKGVSEPEFELTQRELHCSDGTKPPLRVLLDELYSVH